MSNLRIVNINYADLATSIAASTTTGLLVAANMRTDEKIAVHRSTGTGVTYTLTWGTAVSVGAVALPATNLTSAATIRAWVYSDTACTVQIADTGTITACPGLNLGLWAWSGGALNANAFAYGGASKAVAWFAANHAGVKGLKVDLSDATNPAGFIDCARIVAGPWWAPEWNTAGASAAIVDSTENSRSDAGDLKSDRAPIWETLSFSLPVLPESDRATVRRILRGNGAWKPVFVSLSPGDGVANEQDGMIFGKLKPGPLDNAFFGHHATKIEIEGW